MALDQHGALLKMVVIFSQHHLTGRPCWSGLSWFICLSTRLWALPPSSLGHDHPRRQARASVVLLLAECLSLPLRCGAGMGAASAADNACAMLNAPWLPSQRWAKRSAADRSPL